jgi:hypothetical protein
MKDIGWKKRLGIASDNAVDLTVYTEDTVAASRLMGAASSYSLLSSLPSHHQYRLTLMYICQSPTWLLLLRSSSTEIILVYIFDV